MARIAKTLANAAFTASVIAGAIGVFILTIINFLSGCGTEIPGSFCIFIGN